MNKKDRVAVLGRMVSSGIRVWRSTAEDRLSVVIIKDEWGGINEVPEELYGCFTVRDRSYSVPIYGIH